MEDQPLGLTVHSMPQPGDAQAQRRTVHGRWKMLAVMLVCAAPVLASYFTFYVVRPEGGRAYGELIEAQPELPDVPATLPDGQTQSLTALRKQWLLVSVGGGACEARCEHNLYLQRQLRESLGREKDRMDWVWLVDDAAPVRPELAQGIRQATTLRVDRAALAAWLAPAEGRTLEEHLYVVDPMGRWMMRFPADMDAKGAARAKRDLERLLRASSSWDEAGR
ncbi:hypothetical protein AAFF27_06400 [Xylophilus sp. GW821-FHT01B05]